MKPPTEGQYPPRLRSKTDLKKYPSHHFHSQSTKFLNSFKVAPKFMHPIVQAPLIDQNAPRIVSPSPQIKRLPPRQSDIRRIKAFRVPLSYVADQLVGYQGKGDKFKMYRMAPEQLPPDGWKIIAAFFEHPRNCFYFQIEHPSFPEHTSGEKLEAMEMMIEEIDVERVQDTIVPLDDSNWWPVVGKEPVHSYPGTVEFVDKRTEGLTFAETRPKLRCEAEMFKDIVALGRYSFWRYGRP